jgi:hypothetical protein
MMTDAQPDVLESSSSNLLSQRLVILGDRFSLTQMKAMQNWLMMN